MRNSPIRQRDVGALLGRKAFYKTHIAATTCAITRGVAGLCIRAFQIASHWKKKIDLSGIGGSPDGMEREENEKYAAAVHDSGR